MFYRLAVLKISAKFTKKIGSSHLELFLGNGVLKICRKFTGEHSCRNVISRKLQSNFIEIALRRGCSTLNFLHIFITSFPKNASGWLLLKINALRIKISSKNTVNNMCTVKETIQKLNVAICSVNWNWRLREYFRF